MPGLPKPESLRKRSDFLRVQGQGRRFKRYHMVLLIHPGPDGLTRVGYTVSRKVGNAVVRNRVRRRLREIVRLHQDALAPSFDHVIIAYPSCAKATAATLRDELTCLMDRAQRWALDNASSSAS